MGDIIHGDLPFCADPECDWVETHRHGKDSVNLCSEPHEDCCAPGLTMTVPPTDVRCGDVLAMGDVPLKVVHVRKLANTVELEAVAPGCASSWLVLSRDHDVTVRRALSADPVMSALCSLDLVVDSLDSIEAARYLLTRLRTVGLDVVKRGGEDGATACPTHALTEDQ